MYSVLIIEDNERLLQMLKDTLASEAVEVEGVKTAEDGLKRLGNGGYDFVLLDLKLPGMQGIEALKKMKKMNCQSTVIITTAYGTIDVAVEAMRLGAYDFLTKPFDTDHLLLLRRRGLAAKQRADRWHEDECHRQRCSERNEQRDRPRQR